MRKLLLASSGTFVTDGDYEIFNKPREEIKWAHITTAKNKVVDTSYIARHKQRMNELGYDYEDIDITGKSEDELWELLKNKEAIFVEGGNTYYLLKVVKETGFDKIVNRLLDKGVVYVGTSAGSYIACPTIEMMTWKDTNNFDRCGLEDFTALNLVPFLIKCHYVPENEELFQQKAKESGYPVKFITDDQALLILDDKVKLVGKGKEVKLT